MATKYDFQYVKEFFEHNGYELCSIEFHHSQQILECVCPAGHKMFMRWHHFKAGRRCAKCRGNSRLVHDDVAAFFEKEGCLLLNQFTSSRSILQYRCTCGRIAKTRWYDFKRGKRCRGCLGERQSGDKNPRWNPDRKAVESRRKLAHAAHTAIKTTCKYLGKKKNAKTYQLLGYSGDDLRKHLELHPNWEQMKDKNWSLDHVFPIKAFVDFGIYDIRLINSLENLQPMILKENQSKSKTYSKELFVKWLKEKGYAV